MIQKVKNIDFEVYDNRYFPERYAWVYLEGSSCLSKYEGYLSDYEISIEDLEAMAFGC